LSITTFLLLIFSSSIILVDKFSCFTFKDTSSLLFTISKFEKSLQETYDRVVLGGNKGDKSKTHKGEDYEEEDEKDESVTEKKSRKEYLDDGFVEAEVNKSGNGLRKGQEVYVSAEDYTSLGDSDSLECIDYKTVKTTICPKGQLNVKI